MVLSEKDRAFGSGCECCADSVEARHAGLPPLLQLVFRFGYAQRFSAGWRVLSCSSSAMSLHSASKLMGLPGDVVTMIDTCAACTSTPQHTAFAIEHGVRNVARLCACGPCFAAGYYRYEWSSATPPFYDAPRLSVDVAACLVDPCVLCCPLSILAPLVSDAPRVYLQLTPRIV